MKKKFSKQQVREKELVILFSLFIFLFFAYRSGNYSWIKDFQLIVDLFASSLAFFVGVLAMVRYFTKKTNVNYLLLGLGFVTVSFLDAFHILHTLNVFSDLFSIGKLTMFPSSMVLSRVFLALIFFLAWVLTKEEKKIRGMKEKIALGSLLGAISVFTIAIVTFTTFFEGFESYQFAISMQTIALMMYLFTLIGYAREEGMYYRNFDFWLMFSVVFSIISQIFFLPYLNIEYELMLNLTTLTKFLSYFVQLVGFLCSIYEMYKREEQVQKELENKNFLIKLTKQKVEEAYMVLREEKWKLSKESKKKTTDKIFKDILKKK